MNLVPQFQFLYKWIKNFNEILKIHLTNPVISQSPGKLLKVNDLVRIKYSLVKNKSCSWSNHEAEENKFVSHWNPKTFLRIIILDRMMIATLLYTVLVASCQTTILFKDVGLLLEELQDRIYNFNYQNKQSTPIKYWSKLIQKAWTLNFTYGDSEKLLFLLACILILTLTLCIYCSCSSCCEFPRCSSFPQRYQYAVSVPVSDRRRPRRYRQDDDDATLYAPSNF